MPIYLFRVGTAVSKVFFNLPCTKIGTDHGCVGLLQSVGREVSCSPFLNVQFKSSYIQRIKLIRSEGVDDIRVAKSSYADVKKEEGFGRNFSNLYGPCQGVTRIGGWDRVPMLARGGEIIQNRV